MFRAYGGFYYNVTKTTCYSSYEDSKGNGPNLRIT